MNLLRITLNGFRRFSQKSTLNCSGRIVALLGPNESGKSSCLEALMYLNNDDEIKPHDISRDPPDVDQTPIIEAEFEVSGPAVSRFINIGIEQPLRLLVQKMAGGTRHFELQHRDILSREQLNTLDEKLTAYFLSPNIDSSSLHVFEEFIDFVKGRYEDDEEGAAMSAKSARKEASRLIKEKQIDSEAKELIPIIDKFIMMIDHELYSQSVRNVAVEVLPQFSFFSEDDRFLKSDYNLESIVEKKTEQAPRALMNLLKVAGVDLEIFWDNAKRRNDAALETIRARAHDELDYAIAEHWSQAQLKVRLHFDRPLLKIQIEDSGRQFSNLGERSDGLRQFMALMAFCFVEQQSNPILLIDEAEMHLHYDGQADLVQVLSKQHVASKVIYTTHSVGCLPEDLGFGIRLLEVEGSRSFFKNWFWADAAVGFSPILLGIGASTLAFFPVRNAVLAEGESDMLLLPTLIREATERMSIGYQVVPGLARAGQEQIQDLCHAGKRVVHVVDNDAGGKSIAKRLKKGGVSLEKIIPIAAAGSNILTIEDLIDSEVLVKALNNVLGRAEPKLATMEHDGMPDNGKASAIKEWCESIGIDSVSKRAIAYELLDMKANDSGLKLTQDGAGPNVAELDEKIRRELGTDA